MTGTVHTMEQRTLKERLLYAPRKGLFYWINPPAAHAELLGEEAGSVQGGNKSYHAIQIDGVKYRRGRLAFLYMEGRWPTECIDHINGNSLDDRWLNLREATATQNAWNHKGRSKAADLPMGVRINSSGRFAARIGVNGTQVQIGTFDTEEQAAEAYKIARRKYFGQYA